MKFLRYIKKKYEYKANEFIKMHACNIIINNVMEIKI